MQEENEIKIKSSTAIEKSSGNTERLGGGDEQEYSKDDKCTKNQNEIAVM